MNRSGRASPAALVANLRRAVFESAAAVDPRTRRAAADGGPLPEPWPGYAAKVRDQSSRVTDADVDALKAAGASEDDIFEVTVSAAVGAAVRSLDAGLHALGGEPGISL
jgi:hypothetical protein